MEIRSLDYDCSFFFPHFLKDLLNTKSIVQANVTKDLQTQK